MSHAVEVSDEGTSRPPADVPEQVKPHTRFTAEVHNGTAVLRPENGEQPFWATATPEEWVRDVRRRDTSHRGGPGLSDEAVSRESIYE